MSKKNPILKKAWDQYGDGLDINDAVWQAHGVTCIKHAYLEILGARAGIEFAEPLIVHQDPAKQEVVVCVTGAMKDRREWSFGEVTPKNNKNQYPYAMAEKRAKDRVILKLIGIHGFVYSEDEADDFKNSRPGDATAKTAPERTKLSVMKSIASMQTERNLELYYREVKDFLDGLEEEDRKDVLQAFGDRKTTLTEQDSA